MRKQLRHGLLRDGLFMFIEFPPCKCDLQMMLSAVAGAAEWVGSGQIGLAAAPAGARGGAMA